MRGLYIGIGGTGDEILASLKDKVFASVGAIPHTLQFRLVDTEAEDYRKNKGVRLEGNEADAVIQGNEYLQLADHPPGTFYSRTQEVARDRRAHPEIARWYRADLFLEKLPEADFSLVRGAGQHRQFARMGLFLNKQRISTMLRHALEKCGGGAGELPIWIVGSVAGGTGAGLFMDLAMLARLVSEELGVHRRIIGAAVLPDVFKDVGIDAARAYAVLRELERFQAPVPNGYLGRSGEADTRFSARYDSTSAVNLKGMLFDNLVFYNRECKSEDDRKSYFSEVADGFNLLLDPSAGDQIFREWINAREGAATSFNTHRIYIPISIYRRQFILQAAMEVANALLPRDLVSQALLAGAADDRHNDARQIIDTELPGLLQELSRPASERERDELSARMNPGFIVRDMFGFDNPNGVFRGAAGEDLVRAAQRLYDNLTGDVPTVREAKENFDDSRQRVLNEVVNRRRAYEGDGAASFNSALAAIRPLITRHLAGAIDESLRKYLTRQPVREQALGRTQRVLSELDLMLTETRKTLDLMVARDAAGMKESMGREATALQALEKLERKPFVWKGQLADAETGYLTAVDTVTRLYQREKLVAFLREMIQEAQGHVQRWAEGLRDWQAAILQVVEKATNEDNDLAQRLERQRKVRSASMGLNNVADMNGYRESLRQKCLLNAETNRSIIEDLMQSLVWRPGAQPKELALDNWPELGPLSAADFPKQLLSLLTAAIGHRIAEFEGMTNYIKWLRDEKRDRPVDQAADRLRTVTSPFLDNQATSESRRLLLLHGDDWNSERDGENVFEAINNVLVGNANMANVTNNLTDANGINLFKDRNVLAVLMVDNQIPYQKIGVFKTMRAAYMGERNKTNSEWRADTYHLFRCDQEAWRIERRQVEATRDTQFPEIPGQYARLLDDPQRVALFCKALAVGVIRSRAQAMGGLIQVCGPLGSDDPRALIFLNDPEDDNDPRDLLRALVTFVLDQKDRRRGIAGPIDMRTVTGWIEAALTQSGQTLEASIAAFAAAHPDLLRVHPGGGEGIDKAAFLALVLNHYLGNAT